MKYRFINYNERYKKEVQNIMTEFQKYLKDLDSWRVFKLEKDYGKKKLEELLKLAKKYKGKFLIVKAEKEIVGYIFGYIQQDKKNVEMLPWKCGYIDELYLKKNYRGIGIGRELLAKMEGYFREKKCDTMGFNAMINNKEAIEFYEKNGFERRSLFLAKAFNKKIKK